MKYYNTFILLYIFGFQNALTFQYDEALIQLINDNAIIFDGKIGTLKLFLNEYAISNMDELILKYPNMPYTAMKCKYADYIVDLLQSFCVIFKFGIEKSDIENNPIPKAGDPQTIWLSTGIEELNNTKILVEKIVFYLFHYMDKNPELRTSDQSLLKSLVTLNLFLRNIKNTDFIRHTEIDNENINIIHVVFLVKSIMQIINGIDQFRWKNCLVDNPYGNVNNTLKQFETNKILIENKEKISETLSPTQKNIKEFIDIQSVSDTKFTVNMYDPEFLLLNILLKPEYTNLGEVIIIENGTKSTLKNKFENAVEKFNINEILYFQNELISIIADMFYRETYFSLTKSTIDLDYLKKILSNFEVFLNKFMLKHCLMDICIVIIEDMLILRKTFQDEHKAVDEQILSSTVIQFKNRINDKFVYKTEQNKELNDSSLFTLIEMIEKNNNKSFYQVFNLLSYESHLNKHFYVDQIIDYENKLDGHRNYQLLNSIDNLRYFLFIFMLLQRPKNSDKILNNVISKSAMSSHGQSSTSTHIKIAGDDSHDSNLLSATEKSQTNHDNMAITNNINGSDEPIYLITQIVLRYFKLFEDNTEIKYILLPLLNRFKHSVQLSSESDLFNVTMLYQTVFVTINLLEHYLLQTFVASTYNWDVFNFASKEYNSQSDNIKLNKILQDKKRSSAVHYNLNIVDTYNKDLDEQLICSENDEFIVFNWNGTKKNCFEISVDLSQRIIDLNDLISYQWFKIQFFAVKILVAVKNAIEIFDSQNNHDQFDNNDFNFFRSELDKFWNHIHLPKSIRHFLDRTIKVIDDTFNLLSSNFKCDKRVYWYIEKNLKLLGVIDYEKFVSKKESNKIGEALKEDIKSFDQLLNGYSVESKQVYFSKDLILSPTTNLDTVYDVEVIGLQDTEIITVDKN